MLGRLKFFRHLYRGNRSTRRSNGPSSRLLSLFALFIVAFCVDAKTNLEETFDKPASLEASIEALEARHLEGDPEALLVLASIYCNLERWYPLQNLLEAMEGKAYLEDARFYFTGRIALAENRLGSARRAFKQALKSNPEASRSIRAQLFFYQAICWLKLKQYESAKGAFEEALAYDFVPETRKEIVKLAGFYARFRSPQETLSWFKSIPPEIQDSEAELSAILGRTYLKESFPFLAIKAFSQSLSLQPKQTSILTLRASAHRLVGDFRSAERDIAEAIALDPVSNRAEQDYLYGLILFEGGELERAHAVFSQRFSAVKDSEKDSAFLLLYAQLACTVGAMQDAQKALDSFFQVEAKSNHFNAHALALLLRLPELRLPLRDTAVIPNGAPAIFELSLLKNHIEGRNSLAYLIEQSKSASLTFFLAQIEAARGLEHNQVHLLKETLRRTTEQTPEYLGAVWQLERLEN